MTATPATPLAPEVYRKTSTQTVPVSVSFQGLLDDGTVPSGGTAEKITSIVSVTSTPAGLTLAGDTVSTTILKINGVEVPIGQAIQFTAAAGTDLTDYVITALVSTDGGHVNLPGWCTLQVRDS